VLRETVENLDWKFRR